PVTRSEIWHPDGSVVIQAQNTQFRVHWSVLSLHSSLFRGMLELPQPQDTEQPSVDGCPIVELSDESEDVKQVLGALYNPLFLGQKALPLRVIGSLLRICRKYEFRDVLQNIVERLTYENPATLEGYDALKTGNAYSPTRIQNHHGILYDTITLAWENNILSVLPCAYYRALSAIFDGIPRGDGTVATLAPIHQRACTLGRASLFSAQWDTGNTFGWTETTANCTDVPGCKLRKQLFFRRHVVRGSLAPFCALGFVDSLNLCAACTADVKTKMIEGRRKMWEMLPGFFELPPWSEL
ncbi:hypothetical protein GGX14DRAFT_630052, partial [Mycena pura]